MCRFIPSRTGSIFLKPTKKSPHPILFSLLIARLTHRVYVRFGAAFIINFAYFSIQMFFDDSYVNYTSFIVTGGVAVFIALLMVWMMHSFDKLFEN